MKKYKFLEHTADMKFSVSGRSIEEIFENSVYAISGFITKERHVKKLFAKKFKVSAKDNEELFYKFIDEIIYLLDADTFLVSEAKVSFSEKNGKKELNVLAWGDNARNYNDLDYMKAATYSEMYIKKTKNGWKAQAVVDI